MVRCRQCNITILDDTEVCPLCRCAVERDAETDRINEYPEVMIKQRKVKLMADLILVAVLAAAMVLMGLNAALYEGSLWCLIPIAAMAYVYLAFRMIFVSRKGYRSKVFIPMVLALGLLLIIDIETGFYGWSLDYILPSVILVADMIILMLMLTNMKNWSSYMIMQLTVLLACMIPLFLWFTGLIGSPVLTLITVAISVSMFLGMLIIGGNTAKQELKIRFHIR